ncbi:restriction endonuclease subunit S [Cellulophaga sp. Hel_I_12]|uniref:restriction endonuclease subunit S n=1 Tax=Cellulophaga sp. Hel_I_12 TaxID=1249972 RepID=UPI0006481935|nr:restriction endonuclease subunit S [Cellulophaga sp. Hel_I_12]
MIDEIELASLYAKKTKSLNPKKFKDETFELYSIRAFDNGYPEIITGAEIGSSKKILEYNDVILSRIVPHIRRCWVVPKSDKLKQIGSGEWIVFRSDKIYPDFLRYFLLSNPFHSMFMNTVKGVGGSLLRADPKQVGRFKIPLPSLNSQQLIASILDDASLLRDKTMQLLKEYDLLEQSIFLDMFGDVVNNPKNWKTKTIEGLVVNVKGSIKRGPFGGALKKEIFVKQGYLVYEQYHALNNDFNFERYYIDDKNFERLKGFEVKPGDIIISCSGVYLGKLAIIPKDAKKGIINQALLKVTLDEQKMRKDFFVFHFTQQNFRDKYFGANRGAGIPNFPPMASFKKFPFIAPPINLQNQFAEKIDLIEQQKELAKQELQESEDLFNCLLQKAFKGELA